MCYWLAVVAVGLIAMFAVAGCGSDGSAISIPPNPFIDDAFDYVVSLDQHHDLFGDDVWSVVSIFAADSTDSLSSARLWINGDSVALNLSKHTAYTMDFDFSAFAGELTRIEGDINGHQFDTLMPLAHNPLFELENNWWFYQGGLFQWTMPGDNMAQCIYGQLSWQQPEGSGSDADTLYISPSVRNINLPADWIAPDAHENLTGVSSAQLGVYTVNWLSDANIFIRSESTCSYAGFFTP